MSDDVVWVKPGVVTHVSEFVMLTEGDDYLADDPIVKRYPWAFTDVAPAMARRDAKAAAAALGVEQATAAPGERRNTRR